MPALCTLIRHYLRILAMFHIQVTNYSFSFVEVGGGLMLSKVTSHKIYKLPLTFHVWQSFVGFLEDKSRII